MNLGFQFNSSIALSDEAINIAGSPALLGATSAGIGWPVTFLATSTTSFTVHPVP